MLFRKRYLIADLRVMKNFSNTDVDKLMFTLQDKFNLRCSIHYNRDKKPRIYIFKESMETLISLVKPYFIKEMLYKLGL